MVDIDKNFTRVADEKSFNMKVGLAARPGIPQAESIAATVVIPFEMVRHLLSKRPLRRPNRNRPIG